MAGRRLTGARRFDAGFGANFRSPEDIPINQASLPAGNEFVAPMETFEQGASMGGFELPPLTAQPLPEAVGQELPSSQRFFITEEPGQAPKLSNVPTGSPYERELQLPEQQTFAVDGREVTVSGDRPLDEGGRGVLAQALAPPVEEAMPEGRGTALEQAQDLFNQLQDAGVASEFQAAMKETGLDQQIKLEERIAKASPEAAGISEVQSSKILPSGFTQIVRKDGTVELKSVKDSERELIKDLEKRGAELQGLRAGEREAAKTAQVKSKQAFEKMTLAQENIISIDKAITELGAGANTGVVMSLLPSFKASTIRLENIQKQLGLNVIGGVTFGALSKGELDLALSKALPTDLQPEDLRDWLIDYKAAQEKLITNLQDAAIFLGTPGNTVAKFLARNKEQAAGIAEAPAAEAGGVQEGATATNPATGAKIIFRGGQWQTA